MCSARTRPVCCISSITPPKRCGSRSAPFGRDLAIGYLGGRFAAELEAAGPAAMAAFAEDKLVAVFGAGLRQHIRGVASTGWVGDPEIGGGYSRALPGLAHLRRQLAAPLAERLFFAGEACSLDAYGTVHGAATSGIAAAHAAAGSLRVAAAHRGGTAASGDGLTAG
jgi:monoamine oxidase